MIAPIRLATPEEIEKYSKTSDINPNTLAVAFENNIAFIRPTTEVDPVYFDPEAPRHKRALMLWGIEQILRFRGATEYYFNVSTDNKEFIEDVQKMGCVNTSPTPEFRFKKVL